MISLEVNASRIYQDLFHQLPRRKSINHFDSTRPCTAPSQPLPSIIKSRSRKSKTISSCPHQYHQYHQHHIVSPHRNDTHSEVIGHDAKIHSSSETKRDAKTLGQEVTVTVRRIKSVTFHEPLPSPKSTPTRHIPRCFQALVDPLLSDLASRPESAVSKARYCRTRKGESLVCQVMSVQSYSMIKERSGSRAIWYIVQGSVEVLKGGEVVHVEGGQSISVAALERTTMKNVGCDEVLVLVLTEALNGYGIAS